MADDDRSAGTPSLEPPSLGLGRWRRKKQDAAAEAAAEEPTATLPVAEPETPPAPPADPPVQAASPAPARTPVPAPAARTQARPAPADTTVLPADETHEDADEQAVEDQPRGPSRLRATMTGLQGRTAAALTGLVVGLMVVALTWLSLRLCELLQGTPSCGNPGFFLLLAIMVAMVVLGGALLRACQVPDPTSTAFLAVGLLCVIALLFLVEALMSPWMTIVIPLVAVGTFVLSHWLTTAVIEPATD